MAKSFQERIASARSTDRVTIETLDKLLVDIGEERERLTLAHARASAESIDFALSESDRDEAAANAERYSRTLVALGNAADELGEKLIAKRESEGRKAAAAEKQAALAERDEIAAEFAEFMPKAVETMIALFSRIEGNEKRMGEAGLREACAEAVARGVPRFLNNSGERERYLKLKLPAWNRKGRAWPPDAAQPNNWIAQVEEGRRRAIIDRKEVEVSKRKAAEAFAKAHGRYQLKSAFGGEHTHFLAEDLVDEFPVLPATISTWAPWQGTLPHVAVEQIRVAEPNLVITCLDEERRK